MAANDGECERPRKIAKTLKEKDAGKRLIVVLEKASLETVKVVLDQPLDGNYITFRSENYFKYFV